MHTISVPSWSPPSSRYFWPERRVQSTTVDATKTASRTASTQMPMRHWLASWPQVRVLPQAGPWVLEVGHGCLGSGSGRAVGALVMVFLPGMGPPGEVDESVGRRIVELLGLVVVVLVEVPPRPLVEEKTSGVEL